MCVRVCAVEVRSLYASLFHLGGFASRLRRRARSRACGLLQSIPSSLISASASAPAFASSEGGGAEPVTATSLQGATEEPRFRFPPSTILTSPDQLWSGSSFNGRHFLSREARPHPPSERRDLKTSRNVGACGSLRNLRFQNSTDGVSPGSSRSHLGSIIRST